ncbi:hypothetical protein EVAR_32606_1 [Eumeta japonica]|uniref:Uncharacterized protein n=1 Tax=Eumeta variegata TaxID=151549 RepID=A0A4C1WGS5_EUMVA|nr:hypothetical protein EVAR_32606_1 [Eumeta japonica]
MGVSSLISIKLAEATKELRIVQEGTGFPRESLPGLVPGGPISGGDKFLYREIGSSRLDCDDEVRPPDAPSSPEGQNDDWKSPFLYSEYVWRKSSGGAIKRGSFDTYWSSVDHRQRGYRGVGFFLSERLSECVNNMSKLLEEREEYWVDVRDILVKCDRNERIITLVRKVVGEKKKNMALRFTVFKDLLSAKANYRVKRKDILKDKLKYAEKYMIDDGNESEITKAQKRMKVGKAAGYDRVSLEMLRGGEVIVISLLYQFFNKC